MRHLIPLFVCLVLFACGSKPQLTEEHMDRMSDADVMSLLQCQTEKVVADMGQEEGIEHITDLVEKLRSVANREVPSNGHQLSGRSNRLRSTH